MNVSYLYESMYVSIIALYYIYMWQKWHTKVAICRTLSMGMSSSSIVMPVMSPDAMYWNTAGLSTGKPAPPWTMDIAVHCPRYLKTFFYGRLMKSDTIIAWVSILCLLKHISLHNKLKHYVVQVHAGTLKCMNSEAESKLHMRSYILHNIQHTSSANTFCWKVFNWSEPVQYFSQAEELKRRQNSRLRPPQSSPSSPTKTTYNEVKSIWRVIIYA